MPGDVLNRIVNQAEASPFYAIQLDESTDVAGFIQLSVFIRYIYNGEVSENLLFCKALPLHTKGEDIFKCLDAFFNEHSIPWENCAEIPDLYRWRSGKYWYPVWSNQTCERQSARGKMDVLFSA